MERNEESAKKNEKENIKEKTKKKKGKQHPKERARFLSKIRHLSNYPYKHVT